MSASNGKRMDYLPPPSLTAGVDVARLVAAVKELASRPERKALRLEEAAESLGVSPDFFRERVLPDLRIVREGRIKLVPLKELDRWLDANATKALE